MWIQHCQMCTNYVFRDLRSKRMTTGKKSEHWVGLAWKKTQQRRSRIIWKTKGDHTIIRSRSNRKGKPAETGSRNSSDRCPGNWMQTGSNWGQTGVKLGSNWGHVVDQLILRPGSWYLRTGGRWYLHPGVRLLKRLSKVCNTILVLVSFYASR